MDLEDSIRHSEILNRFLVKFPSYPKRFSSLREDTLTYIRQWKTSKEEHYNETLHTYDTQSPQKVYIENTPLGYATPPLYQQSLQTIASHPGFSHTNASDVKIQVDHSRSQPRGQMDTSTIIFSWSIDDKQELQKVFIHELGHFLDINYLVSGLLSSDKSTKFYNISWKTVREKKAGSSHLDFISWYASTNKYEDFAESFTFYIFHNAEFQKRASSNAALYQKYIFIEEHLFSGEYFSDTSYEKKAIEKVIWDTTKIPIHNPW